MIGGLDFGFRFSLLFVTRDLNSGFLFFLRLFETRGGNSGFWLFLRLSRTWDEFLNFLCSLLFFETRGGFLELFVFPPHF